MGKWYYIILLLKLFYIFVIMLMVVYPGLDLYNILNIVSY